jgi:hypothetical protein
VLRADCRLSAHHGCIVAACAGRTIAHSRSAPLFEAPPFIAIHFPPPRSSEEYLVCDKCRPRDTRHASGFRLDETCSWILQYVDEDQGRELAILRQRLLVPPRIQWYHTGLRCSIEHMHLPSSPHSLKPCIAPNIEGPNWEKSSLVTIYPAQPNWSRQQLCRRHRESCTHCT